jgi:hypothetical protein
MLDGVVGYFVQNGTFEPFWKRQKVEEALRTLATLRPDLAERYRDMMGI